MVRQRLASPDISLKDDDDDDDDDDDKSVIIIFVTTCASFPNFFVTSFIYNKFHDRMLRYVIYFSKIDNKF